MTPVYRADLLPHCKYRIKGGGRLLKNHCNIAAKDGASLSVIQGGDIPAVNFNTIGPDRDPGCRKQPQDGHCRHCFPTAGLSNQSRSISCFDAKADLIHDSEVAGTVL